MLSNVELEFLELFESDLKVSPFFDELHGFLVKDRPSLFLGGVEVESIHQNAVSDEFFYLKLWGFLEQSLIERLFADEIAKKMNIFGFFFVDGFDLL